MPTSAAVSRPHSTRESFAASVRAQEWMIKKRRKQGQKSCCNHPVLMNVQCCDDSPAIQGGEDSSLDGGDEKPFQQPCFGTTCQSMKRQSWRSSPEDRGRSSEASVVSQITWEVGPECCPSYSQLCDMEGVTGRQMSRDLWLKAVDVAAVAEQVAIQWITAVSLFII